MSGEKCDEVSADISSFRVAQGWLTPEPCITSNSSGHILYKQAGGLCQRPTHFQHSQTTSAPPTEMPSQ